MDTDNFLGIVTTVVVLLVAILYIGIFANKHIFGNKQFFDFKQTFTTAYIELPDGTSKKLKIKKWNDYKNSDSIQVIDENGIPFYTHLSRVVLTKD